MYCRDQRQRCKFIEPAAMFFYRQGELTDEKERAKLEVQEAGDEFQIGLALAALSVLFIFVGLVLLIVYAGVSINSLRISGEWSSFDQL